MKCECCGKKVKWVNKDFRFSPNGSVQKYIVCDDCLDLCDTEFFDIMYNDIDVQLEKEEIIH